jgi:hypothetical protein
MFQVYEEACEQCLLSKDRIVPGTRAADIIKECKAEGSYFVCHKSSLYGDGKTCCRAFYDQVDTQIIQIANRLGVVEFIPLPEEKL